MLRLRVKTKDGSQIQLTDKVGSNSSLAELLSAIHDVTHIPPHKQKILIGFPPKAVTGGLDASLSTIGIRNGEVIIVEETIVSSIPGPVECIPKLTPAPKTSDPSLKPTEPSPNTQNPTKTTLKPTEHSANPTKMALKPTERSEPSSGHSSLTGGGSEPQGILLKKVVPSDNSCLFASIYFLVNGGEKIKQQQIYELRRMVSDIVRKNPDEFSEAVLEKTNAKYCEWIEKETSWGGAIELAIFSQYYETEIVAIDSKTGILNRFGEDKKYDYRMIVMYDGIHYDPVYMETFDGHNLYIFPITAISVLEQANQMACEAKQSGQFTDTAAFQLKCKDCGFVMKGEDAALNHAMTTKHTNFEEVNK